MRFGAEPVANADGAILAHSLRLGSTVLKKGKVLGRTELAALADAGIRSVTVARLEAADIVENDAAQHVAQAAMGPNVVMGPATTGRVNLYAAQGGLVTCDPAAVDRVNAVTEDVTLATLALLAPVPAGRMIATVKIIPFSVRRTDLARCAEEAAAARIEILPFRPIQAVLVQTTDTLVKPSVLEKTARITGERLTSIGSTMKAERRCAHTADDLAAVLAEEIAATTEMILVIGASAIVDRRDVIPSAIERLGGRIERLGMPVDPGNLILIGEIGATPVLGLPGCARSPARNGFDWVIERIAAGLPVRQREIAGMGVGGLLIGAE